MNIITKMVKGCKAKLALAVALLASASAFAEDATVSSDAVTAVNDKLDALNTSLGTTQGKVVAVAVVIAGIAVARLLVKKFFRV